MDILHRRLFEEGETCYFLRASVDNPFIYLRFRGTIKTRYTSQDLILYHIQITEVLENAEICKQFLNRKKYRIWDSSNSRTYNKPFYVYDILSDDTAYTTFQTAFVKRYRSVCMDVHSILVYSDLSELNEYRIKTIEHLQETLNSTLTTLNQQSKQ
jgi:transcription initiation factor IIE alpha subunit